MAPTELTTGAIIGGDPGMVSSSAIERGKSGRPPFGSCGANTSQGSPLCLMMAWVTSSSKSPSSAFKSWRCNVLVRTGEFTETWKWELGTDEFQDAGVIIYSIHIKKQIYIYIDKYAYVYIYICFEVFVDCPYPCTPRGRLMKGSRDPLLPTLG